MLFCSLIYTFRFRGSFWLYVFWAFLLFASTHLLFVLVCIEALLLIWRSILSTEICCLVGHYNAFVPLRIVNACWRIGLCFPQSLLNLNQSLHVSIVLICPDSFAIHLQQSRGVFLQGKVILEMAEILWPRWASTLVMPSVWSRILWARGASARVLSSVGTRILWARGASARILSSGLTGGVPSTGKLLNWTWVIVDFVFIHLGPVPIGGPIF